MSSPQQLVYFKEHKYKIAEAKSLIFPAVVFHPSQVREMTFYRLGTKRFLLWQKKLFQPHQNKQHYFLHSEIFFLNNFLSVRMY